MGMVTFRSPNLDSLSAERLWDDLSIVYKGSWTLACVSDPRRISCWVNKPDFPVPDFPL